MQTINRKLNRDIGTRMLAIHDLEISEKLATRLAIRLRNRLDQQLGHLHPSPREIRQSTH